MRSYTNALIRLKSEHGQSALLVQSMMDEQANLHIQMAHLDMLLLRLEEKISGLDDPIDFTSTARVSA